jgi:serine/threonine-protein kinase HipA
MTDTAGHALGLWAAGQRVATLGYEPMTAQWSLTYDPAWVRSADGFALSPALPLQPPAGGYVAGAVMRFVQNLLPEGRALEVAASAARVGRSNTFGLIQALGAETTGAFTFWPADEVPPIASTTPAREVTREELQRRLSARDAVPLALWDGRVRMSIAGMQDKLAVYLDAPLEAGGRMFLAEPPLASTHILKPDPLTDATPHLVVNEHFCMSLAGRMGLPVAPVSICRTPRPVLVVTRFDRTVQAHAGGTRVQRLHVIDACQAADLPVDFKYERNFGDGEHVRHIREGVSFATLSGCVERSVNKAATRLTLLRWALFQFLIGNTDAHGKNFSFFVSRQGLSPAPWYDLLSVVQYPSVSHDLAMAFGDEFVLDQVRAFQLADFAKRCGINRRLLGREALRLARLVRVQARAQAEVLDYEAGEQDFVLHLCDFVIGQAERLQGMALEVASIGDAYL